MKARLEVCCADIDSLMAAKEGGASRIELCTALSEGGLTPSIGMIKEAVSLGLEEINVLIRCRKGDFLYSDCEMDVMLSDVEAARKAGATGIVWGALTSDGSIDRRNLDRIRMMSEGMTFTFHRAFDLCADPEKALEEIIRAGCTCLLSSGLAISAYHGIDALTAINLQAAGRIDIMPGAGINAFNCREIIDRTGVRIIHATARRRIESKMEYRRPNVSMGAPGEDEYSRLATSADEVRAIIKAIS